MSNKTLFDLWLPAKTTSHSDYTLAIVGSRDFKDPLFLNAKAMEHIKEHGVPRGFVSGGCRGADCYGAAWARMVGIDKDNIVELKPDWKQYGKAAGIIRNTDIIKQADHVIAFSVNHSPGTADSIKKAKDAGKLVVVYECAATGNKTTQQAIGTYTKIA